MGERIVGSRLLALASDTLGTVLRIRDKFEYKRQEATPTTALRR